MNNFYFHSKQFLKIVKKNKEILELFSSIEELRNIYSINPQAIIDIGTNSSERSLGMGQLQNTIKSNNNKILKVVRSKRPNLVYDLVKSLIIDLNLFDSTYNDNNELVKLLKQFPELHTDAYSEKQSKYIFDIIENSSGIKQLMRDAIGKASYIVDEYNKSAKGSPIDYLPLRIGTDQDVSQVDDFVLIFKSIEEIYNFVCYLHKIDAKDKPLIINHLQTGSWYSELLGIKQVVISIENLLKGIGGFIRDYITGKISREKFENECKKAESFMHLLSVAKKNGIDNAELGVFKELSPLIENFKNDTTTIIEINEVEILMLRKTEKLTLLAKKRKRDNLLEKINLSIENGKKRKLNDNKE